MSYMAFSDIQPRNIVVAAMAVLYCAVAWSGPDAERIKKECVNFREDKMLGFDRSIFDFEGCSAWVVEPKAPAADGRWVWCMEWPTAFQDRVGVRALL